IARVRLADGIVQQTAILSVNSLVLLVYNCKLYSMTLTSAHTSASLPPSSLIRVAASSTAAAASSNNPLRLYSPAINNQILIRHSLTLLFSSSALKHGSGKPGGRESDRAASILA